MSVCKAFRKTADNTRASYGVVHIVIVICTAIQQHPTYLRLENGADSSSFFLQYVTDVEKYTYIPDVQSNASEKRRSYKVLIKAVFSSQKINDAALLFVALQLLKMSLNISLPLIVAEVFLRKSAPLR